MSCIRQMIEQRERDCLSPRASLSCKTCGRERPMPPDDIRTEYQRDRDRIIHCKSFRRLMHKTQVFLSPEQDHYRTRLTHTLEVMQIGRTISRALMLNEDLCEAVALGHDLGHTPFGHAGESVLQKCYAPSFTHYRQSLRVVDLLENDGEGLNLTFEVRDGILNHTGDDRAVTLEGRIVKFADRIAYINHDIDDAIRAKVICAEDIPLALAMCSDIRTASGSTAWCAPLFPPARILRISAWRKRSVRQPPSCGNLCSKMYITILWQKKKKQRRSCFWRIFISILSSTPKSCRRSAAARSATMCRAASVIILRV